MLVTCERCGDNREVVRYSSPLCRECATKVRIEKNNPNGFKYRSAVGSTGRPKTEYLRVCACGDASWIGFRPELDAECRPCSQKKNGYRLSQSNRKPESEKMTYEHVCSGKGSCGKVRILKTSHKYRKTTYCGDCARRRVWQREENDVRYFRICPECPEDKATVQVSSSKNAGIKTCREHTVKPSGKARKKVTTYKTHRKKTVSDAMIQLERKRNKEHREEVERIKTEPVVQKLTDAEMMKIFLRSNKPSVRASNNEKIPHFVGYCASCSTSSVMA